MNESTKIETNVPIVANEIDVPSEQVTVSSDLRNQTLSTRYVKSLERLKFEHNIEIDKWAVNLLVWCVIAMLSVYAFERIIGVRFGTPESESARIVSEILKFLISSLIGFLFAKRTT